MSLGARAWEVDPRQALYYNIECVVLQVPLDPVHGSTPNTIDFHVTRVQHKKLKGLIPQVWCAQGHVIFFGDSSACVVCVGGACCHIRADAKRRISHV